MNRVEKTQEKVDLRVAMPRIQAFGLLDALFRGFQILQIELATAL